jgi:hypothetical protein
MQFIKKQAGKGQRDQAINTELAHLVLQLAAAAAAALACQPVWAHCHLFWVMHLLTLPLQRQVTLPVPAERHTCGKVASTQHSVAGERLRPQAAA